VSALLPGGADGFDAGGVVGCCRIVDDEELGVLAFGGCLLCALPLAVDVEDAEAGREAWSDFVVEEVSPCCFRRWLVDWAQTEVEMGFYPVSSLCGVSWVALQGWGL